MDRFSCRLHLQAPDRSVPSAFRALERRRVKQTSFCCCVIILGLWSSLRMCIHINLNLPYAAGAGKRKLSVPGSELLLVLGRAGDGRATPAPWFYLNGRQFTEQYRRIWAMVLPGGVLVKSKLPALVRGELKLAGGSNPAHHHVALDSRGDGSNETTKQVLLNTVHGVRSRVIAANSQQS